MNKAKLYTVAIVAAVIAASFAWILFINKEFLLETKGVINLYLLSREWGVSTGEYPMGVYLLVTFLVGLGIGWALCIPGWLRSLNVNRMHAKEVKALQNELTQLKNRPAPDFSLPSGQEESPAEAENTSQATA